MDTDMKGKPCPLIPLDYNGQAIKVCEAGYCPDCSWWMSVQKEYARELAKEIDNLGEK